MKVQLRVRGIESTESLERAVRRRLGFALDRVRHRIRGVRVVVDARRHRRSVTLHLELRDAARAPVRVTATESRLQAALDRAAARLAQSLVRRVGRCRSGAG